MFRSTPENHTMYRLYQGKIKGPIHHCVGNPRENVQRLDGEFCPSRSKHADNFERRDAGAFRAK